MNLQEELKVLRLTAAIIAEVELNTREAQLVHVLEEKKHSKSRLANALAEAKREMEIFHDEYDIMMAEDKSLDKGFKRDFSDQDPHTVDQLYKLFKRRPRYVGWGLERRCFLYEYLRRFTQE